MEEEPREGDIPRYISNENFNVLGKTNEVKVASLGLAPRNLAYAWRYAV